MVPTNTGIFLRGLKLCGESGTQLLLWISKKKIGRDGGGGGGGGSHAFFRGNKALIWTKIRHALLCILRLLRIIVA